MDEEDEGKSVICIRDVEKSVRFKVDCWRWPLISIFLFCLCFTQWDNSKVCKLTTLCVCGNESSHDERSKLMEYKLGPMSENEEKFCNWHLWIPTRMSLYQTNQQVTIKFNLNIQYIYVIGIKDPSLETRGGWQ